MPKQTESPALPSLSSEASLIASIAGGIGVEGKEAISRAVMVVMRAMDGRVTVPEASVLLGVDERSIFRLIDSGAIRTTKRGKYIGQFLMLEDIRRYAERFVQRT